MVACRGEQGLRRTNVVRSWEQWCRGKGGKGDAQIQGPGVGAHCPTVGELLRSSPSQGCNGGQSLGGRCGGRLSVFPSRSSDSILRLQRHSDHDSSLSPPQWQA
eukprot:1733012-Rhodomonas_salina.1